MKLSPASVSPLLRLLFPCSYFTFELPHSVMFSQLDGPLFLGYDLHSLPVVLKRGGEFRSLYVNILLLNFQCQ